MYADYEIIKEILFKEEKESHVVPKNGTMRNSISPIKVREESYGAGALKFFWIQNLRDAQPRGLIVVDRRCYDDEVYTFACTYANSKAINIDGYDENPYDEYMDAIHLVCAAVKDNYIGRPVNCYGQVIEGSYYCSPDQCQRNLVELALKSCPA